MSTWLSLHRLPSLAPLPQGTVATSSGTPIPLASAGSFPVAAPAPAPAPAAEESRDLRTIHVVRDCGALCNGDYNDALAIQSAIDLAIARGGGTVYLPRNTYTIRSMIRLPHGAEEVTLVGDQAVLRVARDLSSPLEAILKTWRRVRVGQDDQENLFPQRISGLRLDAGGYEGGRVLTSLAQRGLWIAPSENVAGGGQQPDGDVVQITDVEAEGCGIGFDVVAVMTSCFDRLRARRCDIGLRLRPDPAQGGACGNSFSDLHLYICTVGVLLYDNGCPYPSPGTNLFRGGSIQGSTHAAILAVGPLVSGNLFLLMHLENHDGATPPTQPIALSETKSLAGLASADVVIYSAELRLQDCSALQRGVWFGAQADIEAGASTQRGALFAPGTTIGGGSTRMERIARIIQGDRQSWDTVFLMAESADVQFAQFYHSALAQVGPAPRKTPLGINLLDLDAQPPQSSDPAYGPTWFASNLQLGSRDWELRGSQAFTWSPGDLPWVSLWLRSDVAGSYALRFQTVSGRDLLYFKLSLPQRHQWTLVRMAGPIYSPGPQDPPMEGPFRLHIIPTDSELSNVTIAQPYAMRVGSFTDKVAAAECCARLFNAHAGAPQ